MPRLFIRMMTPSDPAQKPYAIHSYSWREILNRMMPMLKPHRRKILLALICLTVTGIGAALVPLFPKYVIDDAVMKGDLSLVFLYTGIFVLTQVVRILMWYFSQKLMITCFNQILYDLRVLAFGHIQRLCLRFHHTFSPGFLYEQVFGRCVLTIAGLFLTFFSMNAVQVVMLVFSLFFCLSLSVPLTLILVAGTVGYVFVARRMSRPISDISTQLAGIHNHITEYVVDKIRGTKTIQAFAMEDRVQNDFNTRIRDFHTVYQRNSETMMKLNFLTEGVSHMLTAVLVMGGAAMILDDGMTPGTFIAFLGYQASLVGIVQGLANVSGQFASAKISFNEIFSLLDTRSSVSDEPKASLPPVIRGELTFENVAFSYDENKPVLGPLNTVFSPGQTIALVGRSGSGKTTLTSLLQRFYDPVEGRILLDGVDIRDYPLRKYRSLYGVVLQEPYLFNDSIAGNLRCAKPHATEEELVACLRAASAWDFVEALPGKLNACIGEGGGQLSGGQRQRLAIARCLLADSRFVILDESTSALDNESERLVQQSFQALFHGRTVFVIAHRLSTIRKADRILVMDSGQIVEDGSFDGLIDKKGLFYFLNSLAHDPDALLENIQRADA